MDYMYESVTKNVIETRLFKTWYATDFDKATVYDKFDSLNGDTSL